MDLVETCIESTRLADGKLLKAYRDKVVLPDGSESIREWIDHPGASAVVPLLSDGRVVLLRQFRYAPGREFLEVPAGKRDQEGEEPITVAHRELIEEAGYRAGRLTPLGSTFPCIGYGNEEIHIFLAEDLEEAADDLDADEFVEVVTMPFSEAVELAETGGMLDAKSEVAIYRAAAFLRRRNGGEFTGH
jgi:ADP-ribose pyrophosphatase